MKSWNEIRKAATAFSKRWKNAYDEKAQAQSFLKEFFAVFGVDTVVFNAFEHRVKFSDGSQGYADCFWQGIRPFAVRDRCGTCRPPVQTLCGENERGEMTHAWPGTENLSSFSGGKRIYGIILST